MSNQNLKVIELPESGCKVHLKTSLTYGENRALQGVVMKNMKTKMDPSAKETGGIVPDFSGQDFHEYPFRRLMLVISKLEDKEGKDIGISEQFINDLSIKDGQFLEEEVAKLHDEEVKKN